MRRDEIFIDTMGSLLFCTLWGMQLIIHGGSFSFSFTLFRRPPSTSGWSLKSPCCLCVCFVIPAPFSGSNRELSGHHDRNART